MRLMCSAIPRRGSRKVVVSGFHRRIEYSRQGVV
jgi:hypothetical protein